MRKNLLRVLAAALAGALLSAALFGCAPAGDTQSLPQPSAAPAKPSAGPEQTATPQPETPQQAELSRAVAGRLAGMTLREKVGQMFFVRPDALDPSQTQQQINDADADGVTALTDAMSAVLADYPVGGVVLFGKNITGPQQLTDLTGQLHAAMDTPLLIAVDEEGGTVARLANHAAFDLPRYESAAAVAAAGGAQAVRQMYAEIGGYLDSYGIDLDFAPDADVNTNPDNPVIGTRAFSSDPQTAAGMVAAAVEGFADTGVLCCVKHYPGHGDTAEDSHKSLAATHKTWAELAACELLPFRAGVRAGADLVMAGHIAAPEVTGEDTPASLSPQLMGSIRTGLGFSGAIVTDSLAMEGITGLYSAGEAAVLAVQAGADILLMPNGLAEAFDAVVAAVEEGTIPESRIDESAARVLALKEKRGLI